MNCFNGERYLRTAIESVFVQTWTDWEIVFWDNCSTDGTAEIAQSFGSRVRYFRGERNVLLGAARVLAIAQARGEWLTFLDCDDELHPECFSRQQVAVLDPACTLSYGGNLVIDESGSPIALTTVRGPSDFDAGFEHLLRRYEANIVGTLVRKAAITPLPPIHNYRFAEEYLMFMHAATRGRVRAVQGVVANFRISTGSETEKTSSRQCKELFAANLWLASRTIMAPARQEAMAKAKARAIYHQMKHEMAIGRYGRAAYLGRFVRWRTRSYFVLSFLVYWPRLWNATHRRSIKAILSRIMKPLLSI